MEAAAAGGRTLPLFVLDPHFAAAGRVGARRFAFLLESLADLDASLRDRYGSRLVVVRGEPCEVLAQLMRGECASVPGVRAASVLWEEECVEPWGVQRDASVEAAVAAAGGAAKAVAGGGHLLWEPRAALAANKGVAPTTMPAMLKLAAKLGAPPPPLEAPAALPMLPEALRLASSDDAAWAWGVPKLDSLEGFRDSAIEPGSNAFGVVGGERAGLERLRLSMEREGGEWVRKFEKPKSKSTCFEGTEASTTVLSPYLKFGCVSARTVKSQLDAAYARGAHAQPPGSLLGQLYFREMSYLHALKRGAEFAQQPSPVCADIPWDDPSTDAQAAERLSAWERGATGYPLIDASMRQLKETGWLHHLARHSVACFLTRGDLWLPWTAGAAVFDRELLDADWAVNNFNWLGLSGCAPWSPPYFRVYTPVPDHNKSSLNVQDAQGAFVDKFVPELAKLPAKYKYAPWTAPLAVLNAAGVKLGETYPRPIVDHKTKSKENIAAFKAALAANKEKQKATKPTPPQPPAPKRKRDAP